MFKRILVMLIVMLFVSPCFAQSTEQLVKIHNEITVEINQRRESIVKLQVRQSEIIGVLKYLKAQEDKSNSAIRNFPQENKKK